MRKAHLLGVSFVALLAAGAAAEAGGHAKPKWCGKDMQQEGDDYLKKGDLKHQLLATAYVLCTPDQMHDDDAAANAAAKYKELSARLGFSDDDWADVAGWSGSTDAYNMKRPDQKKLWSTLTPMEQYVSIEHNWIGAENRQGSLDPATFTDVLGPKLSESGRLGWLEKCLTDKMNRGHQVLWALCQPDVEAYDAKKVLAEVKAESGASVDDRMLMRIAAVEMTQRIADHAAEMKALLASDPVYGKMVDLAKQAQTDWAARWKSPGPGLAMMATMEDGLVSNSRRATDGCREKTWNVVKGVIATIPAKQFEVKHKEGDDNEYQTRMHDTIIEALLNDVDGYNAAMAYTMCWKIEPLNDMHEKRQDSVASGVEGLAVHWPGYRGPRTAAWTNIMKAGFQPDDRDARIDYPDVMRPYLDDRGGGGNYSGTQGTVTKATPKGDKIHLEFATHKVKWLQQYGCHNTNHIRGVMANGEFDYEYVCAGAKEKTADEGPSPHDVNKASGATVKPGQVVVVAGDEVMMAFKDSKSTVPVLVYGQPVK